MIISIQENSGRRCRNFTVCRSLALSLIVELSTTIVTKWIAAYAHIPPCSTLAVVYYMILPAACCFPCIATGNHRLSFLLHPDVKQAELVGLRQVAEDAELLHEVDDRLRHLAALTHFLL